MAAQNGRQRWRHEMADKDGVTKWLTKMAAQNGRQRWRHEMADKDGRSKCPTKMASRNGRQRWPLKIFLCYLGPLKLNIFFKQVVF